MFLEKMINQNPELIEAVRFFHTKGLIQPDSYVLDMDAIMENSLRISRKAVDLNLRLYLMTKQFGRNPMVASRILELDNFDGIVAVDYREAETLAKAGLPLGHIGHLVQIPEHLIGSLLHYKPEIITVYSIDNARFIGEEAVKSGFEQPVMLRVWKDKNSLYPQQEGGIHVSGVEDFYNRISSVKGVRLSGVTGFPALVYDSIKGVVTKTSNLDAVKESAKILERLGADIGQINLPSLNHDGTLELLAENGGTHAEPGHGVLGTTPDRIEPDSQGKPALCYLSEISHNFEGKGYCYGGGYYSRSHMQNALVGSQRSLIGCENGCIDYYFVLERPFKAGMPVVTCFRSQIFVTRSRVSVIEGLSKGKPQVAGTFTAQGERVC
ncbi:Predicted amino acid racemase [Alkalispirochaeta americana]|uniref:Predicted amino acid racemase n=1 Tax=Alkalispirochaeta americana TaxID=159291 RepID=A0A1N6XQN8_9SPIO|nr:alanine racemase [Alkalispirochaeta americana]SIR04627.1 Predicted amino acid racemase [Alkalispirochaeta americana]